MSDDFDFDEWDEGESCDGDSELVQLTIDSNINPLTGLPKMAIALPCSKTDAGQCVEFYELAIAGVGVEERCCTCNYSRGWVSRVEPKSKAKKKPAA